MPKETVSKRNITVLGERRFMRVLDSMNASLACAVSWPVRRRHQFRAPFGLRYMRGGLCRPTGTVSIRWWQSPSTQGPTKARSQEAYELGLRSKILCDFDHTPTAIGIRCGGPKS